MSPAALKSLSDGTLVLGMHSNFLAMAERRENLNIFTFRGKKNCWLFHVALHFNISPVQYRNMFFTFCYKYISSNNTFLSDFSTFDLLGEGVSDSCFKTGKAV